MNKAISIHQLYNTKRRLLNFSDKWLASFGKPEVKGSWVIRGESSNGKTSLALQLAKYLTRFEKVLYNSLEEGDSQSFADACRRVKMEETLRGRFLLINENLEELTKRLSREKSPNVIFIDSLQYFGISYDEYKGLKRKFPNKLFIFTCQTEGKKIKGAVADSINFDAFVKVRVHGFKAFVESRYGSQEDFIINEKRAAEIWGEIE